MKCADIAEPMKQLHAEMGGSEPFFQSAVAADLVQIEQHLIAELPVSLRVKETYGSDIFRHIQRLSNTFKPSLLTEPSTEPSTPCLP